MNEQRLAIRMLERRLAEQEAEIKRLHATVARLLSENEKLRAENAELRAEIARLQAENAELRRRLEMNSSNSHKPPSSDGYRKKRVQPALPKGRSSPRRASGSRRKTLRAVEKPDKTVVHLPKQCRLCGRAIGADEPHRVVGKRQVFDLPEPSLEITEHRLGEIECRGQAQGGEYPAYVTSTVQYGPRVRALVTKLSVDHKMPLEQISRLFADLYGYELNSETVETTLEQGYELLRRWSAPCGSSCSRRKRCISMRPGCGLGKLGWLHVACNEQYTHLFVHEKRGEAALRSDASVLKDFQGYAIHDSWASYFKFTGTQHGLCNAHIVRELQGLVEAGSSGQRRCTAFCWCSYAQVRPLSEAAAEQARERYRRILSEAEREEPPPQTGKGRPKNTPGRNLLRRLKEQEECSFGLCAGGRRPVYEQPGRT